VAALENRLFVQIVLECERHAELADAACQVVAGVETGLDELARFQDAPVPAVELHEGEGYFQLANFVHGGARNLARQCTGWNHSILRVQGLCRATHSGSAIGLAGRGGGGGADHMTLVVLPPYVARVAEEVNLMMAQLGFAR
jgi:hypothetical protein